ncbi:MAG: ribonuclease P protein subunit [Crenarchaeota archaeon]|nr:ribonuclease P protein subunit [Thermoproteota archaeon]MDA1124345.1 ribonuclease P protein subunit [Thermoproteota archaeon]
MNLSTQSEFDLIGQNVTISDSKNKEIIGINGKIIMETKNMIIMNTKNGKRNIPKDICQLSSDNGVVIETDSTELNKRPHERLEILV